MSGWSRITSPFTWANALTLFGLAVMAYGLGHVAWSLAETVPAQSWPVARGEVVRAYYVAESYRTKFESGYVYVPAIRYRYTVGGQSYRSDRTWTGKSLRARTVEEAGAFLAAYPEGGPVDVRYDPADPARSTLFAETDYQMVVVVGAGLFLFLLSRFLNRFDREDAARASADHNARHG